MGKVKEIRSRKGGAEKLLKKTMEDGGFSWMRKDLFSKIRVKDFDLVLAQAPRGTHVEITRVLIAQLDVFNFCTLAPIDSFFIVLLTKPIFNEASEASFQGGENPSFLQAIQKRDD
jgi:hypothetical protein